MKKSSLENERSGTIKSLILKGIGIFGKSICSNVNEIISQEFEHQRDRATGVRKSTQ